MEYTTHQDMAYGAQVYPTITTSPTISDEFGSALDELRGVLAELTIRLQPALRPLGPEAESRVSDPMPPVSALRDRLHSLFAASGEVRRILDRLDV